MSVIVDRLPDRADIDFDVAEHLIVELYSVTSSAHGRNEH